MLCVCVVELVVAAATAVAIAANAVNVVVAVVVAVAMTRKSFTEEEYLRCKARKLLCLNAWKFFNNDKTFQNNPNKKSLI